MKLSETDETGLSQPDGPLGKGKIQVEGDGNDHDEKQDDHRRRRVGKGLVAIDEAVEGGFHDGGSVLARGLSAKKTRTALTG